MNKKSSIFRLLLIFIVILAIGIFLKDRDQDDALSVYRNEELGIEFKYPIEWGVVSFSIKTSYDTGKSFSGSFSALPQLSFGGLTRDFREARGAGFTDFRGNPEEITKSLMPKSFAVSSSGISIGVYENQEISQILSSGDVAARLFLQGPEFYGLAFRYGEYAGIPQENKESFYQMIRSIKFTR